MANITNGAPINANYVPKFASATTINNSVIYQNGANIGIGTTTPAAKLDVAGVVQLTGFRLTTSPVTGYVLKADASGNGTWSAPGVGGSGTVNFLPKFTGANMVADSVISETGGNIGVGTTTPGTKLDVNGTAKLGGTIAVPGVFVNGTGNVGIGTSTPGQKLDVNGNINVSGTLQALQAVLVLGGLTGRSANAATPAGVFDNTVGGKILSGQVSGLEKFSVDSSGNVVAAGTVEAAGLKIAAGASNGYVLTSDPAGNAAWLPPALGGGINGTGTPNAFPMFTAATTIGDSLVYESNSKIGIGIDLPQEELTLAQDSNFATEMQIPTDIAYGFQASGGLPADDYYFMLAASDGVGWTKASTEILVTLGSSDHTITLNWSAVMGATNYRVYRALTPGGPYKYIETNATNFAYSNDGLFSLSGMPPTLTTAYVDKFSANGDSWLLGGNVGIGTTSPRAKLDVRGDIIQKAQVFQARMSTHYFIPVAWVIVPFDMVILNTMSGVFDAAAHSFKPSRAGYYQVSVSGHSQTGSAENERYAIGISKNNGIYNFCGGSYCLGDTPLCGCTGIVYLNGSTDFVSITAFSSIPALWSGVAGGNPGHELFWFMNYLGE